MNKKQVRKKLNLTPTDTVWVEWCKQVARSRLSRQPPDKVWADYQKAIGGVNAET